MQKYRRDKMKKNKGILLINLGTPDAPTTSAVRRYLDEFLMDPYVITLPTPLRWILVKCLILPTRPKKSAHAYQQIWTEQGSPLLINSINLKEALAQSLPDHHIALGMRYGNPSIASAVDELMQHDLDELTVLPLFPQYSEAATETAIQSFERAWARMLKQETIKKVIIRDFHDQDFFINPTAGIIREHLDIHKPDLLLLSYHGLPESVGKDYQAQCYTTSKLIAEKLALTNKQYSVSFQSRLGAQQWLKPYTDKHLIELYDRGIRNIAIACPSFVADCLETLEEIGMQAKAQWEALGGESLSIVPCLNSDSRWVSALGSLYISA